MSVLPRRSARYSKAQYIVAALVPALIVALSITGFVWAQKRVTVVVDGKPVKLETQAHDVSTALAEAGVSVQPGDLVSPGHTSQLRSGMTILVRHAVPVTVELGGKRLSLDVVGETVADALIAAGADPSQNSAVTPALDSPLKAGMMISTPSSFVRIEQEETTVAPSVEVRPDPTLPAGERRVISEGIPGSLVRVYRVLVEQGLESTRTLSAERMIAEPVPQIVAVGTARVPRLYAASASLEPAPIGGRRVRVEATGYSPLQPGLDFRCATGARAEHGVIAVDPRFIPLGTHVYVPGYGYAVAADTGGAIKGNRIDLCFDTVEEAIIWGRRSVTIIVLD